MIKKALLAFLLVPMMGLVNSCSSDEKDLPEVDFEVTISGGVQSPDDNKIYVEQGTPLEIESITPVSLNGKRTTLGLTTYYLNGIPQAQTVTVPFGATFETSSLEPGEYAFQIKTSVYQIDKSAAFALLSYDLVVTPATPDDGTDTQADIDHNIVKPTKTQIAEQ